LEVSVIKKNTVLSIALCGVMTSLAIVFGYIEHLIPMPFGIYGIKLGIANLVVITMLYALNAYSAFTINMLRIILCSMLFGSFTSFWYSLVGGLLSFAVMLILKRTNKLSPMGVSICGAISHNIGQITVAIILLDEFKIALYLPVLLITGAITGAIIGLIAIPIIKLPIFNKVKK
jgi:heptaprenyl diphosphate synthase